MKSTVASLVAIALCLAAPAARAVAPPPSSDLAMYLAMDTITNNVAADETGNSTGMTLPSAATASTSAPSTKFGAGSSIDFSGYGLAGGGTITTSNPKAISMSVWVHPDSIPMRVMRFVSLGNERIVLRAQEQGYLHFYMNIDGTLRHIIASGFLTTGRWQHIAGTYDGQTMRLYFDGVQVGSTTIAGNAATGSTGWWASGDGGWFDGKLDEIRVYNRVLSATDVASLSGSRFESNQGSEGGAIAAYSTVFVTGTSFTQNKGFHGGAAVWDALRCA